MAIIPQNGGRFSYTRTGEFRIKSKAEIPVTIIFLLLIPVGDFLLFALIKYLQLEMEQQVAQLIEYACAFWSGLCLFIIGAVRAGVTCKYYADEKEFKITDNHKHTEYLFYADIVNVDYAQTKFFGLLPRGFRVTITTVYRDIVYDYLFFGDFSSDSPEDTPFHLLEQRAYATQELEPSVDDQIMQLREDKGGLL